MRQVWAVFILLWPAGNALAQGPDTETTKLIAELGLRESPQPVRESAGWQKPRRIVLTLTPREKKSKPDAARWLKPVAGGAGIVVVESREVPAHTLQGVDVLLGYCNHANLKNGPDLRYIQNYSAGIDKCSKSPLSRKRRVLVTNMQRTYGPGIAEHVIGLMYMLTRKLHVFHDRQRERKWDRTAVKRTAMWEVQDRTLLIVGLGGIGTEIARRAHGLGMRVIAIRNSSRKGPAFVAYVGLPGELYKLAGQADVVVNAAPLTAATRGLFDRKFFAAMKPGTYFINVGRGPSVVTSDLVAVLNNGHLGGAAVDVTDPEPLPSNHPLWTARNVLITRTSAPVRMSRWIASG